jgi:hypothetical protein
MRPAVRHLETPREIAAARFVFVYYLLKPAYYPRDPSNDFRVQAARRDYMKARATTYCECGRPVAKVQKATLCEACRNDLFGHAA